MDKTINTNTIQFTKPLVDKVGSIDRVLTDFFDTQTREILVALQQKYPDLPENALNQVLNKFATLDGTKQPFKRNALNNIGLKEEQLDFCLTQLEKARILRFEEDTYELAHDTLALHISEKRSADEIALLEITKLVKDRMSNYKNTKTLLSQKEIQWLDNYTIKLKEAKKLTAEEWTYVQKSIKDVSRKRNLKAFFVTSLIMVLVAASIFTNNERVNTEKALAELQVQQKTTAIASYDKYIANGDAHYAKSEYRFAILAYEKAIEIANSYPKEPWKGTNPSRQIMLSKESIVSRSEFERLLEKGDTLFLLGTDKYVDALENYAKAFDLDYNEEVAQNRMNKVKGMLPGAFEDFKRNGDIFFEAAAYNFAKEQYVQAARIQPENKSIGRKLKACTLKLQ